MKKVLNGMIALLATAGLLHGATTHTVPGAFPSIAAALADVSVVDGDTIELTAGTYTLGAVLTVDKRVTIQGVAGTTRDDIIIDGDGKYNISMTASGAVVRALTIRKGGAASGGGVSMGAINTILADCIVTNCASTGNNGGGVAVLATATGAMVTNCIITANSAGSGGGGIALVTGLLVDSIVEGNSATSLYGGGVHLNGANARAERCIIRGNAAGRQAGGVWVGNGTLRNCLVTGNRSTSNISDTGGGGIRATGGTVENCTIVGNSAAGPGGGIEGGNVNFRNLIVTGNTSGTGILGWQNIRRTATTPAIAIANSYIGTGLTDYTNTSGIRTFIEDGDPMFKDASVGDYRLYALSPCRDAGIYQSWMNGAFDLAGNPCPSSGSIADMGCYAYQPSSSLAVFFTAPAAEPGNPVTFTPCVEGDTTGLQIAWDFGDSSSTGTTGTAPASHIYAQAGVYTVTATASNAGAESDVYTHTQYILPDAPVYVGPSGGNAFPYTSSTTAATGFQDALGVLEQMRLARYSTRTLYVCPGVNTLTTNLVVERNFEICGDGTREECIIDGAGLYNICLALPYATGATVRNVTIRNGRAASGGGGITMEVPNTTLANCIVTNCVSTAAGAGGVRLLAGATEAMVTNCIITANTTTDGGGIVLRAGLLVDSIVEGNRSTGLYTGGLSLGTGTVADRCIIRGNTAQRRTGGVEVSGGTLRNSLVVSNTAIQNVSGTGSGGVHVSAAGSAVENCTIVRNHAAGPVGGILLNAAGANFRNLIVTGNTSASGTATQQDAYRNATTVPIANSYIGAGLDEETTNVSGLLKFAKDGAPGFKDDTNNNPYLNNYRLNLKTSPCIGAGLYQSWMDNALDLDGTSRLFKGAVDMGAYQNQESPPPAGTVIIVK